MIKKNVSLLTLTLVLCLILPTISSANQVDFVISQEEAWSDDFDHGNITESGWSVQGFSTDTTPWSPRNANITAEDKTMRVYSTWWSEAWRTSNVAYGSWAFDVHCVDTPSNRFYIAFVSGSPPLDPQDVNTMPFEYGIIPVVGPHSYGNHTFVLYRRPSTSPLLSTLANYDVDNIYGWWHINITRDFEGNFEVYINDTLGITYTDTTHTTSDLFTFTAEAGIALDNIVVVPYPQPPPMAISSHGRGGGG